jgi:hypothetical protein
MIIKDLQVGMIGTNCYILCDELAGVCAVIDPGDEAKRCALPWRRRAASCSLFC